MTWPIASDTHCTRYHVLVCARRHGRLRVLPFVKGNTRTMTSTIAERLASLPLAQQFQALGKIARRELTLPPTRVRCPRCRGLEPIDALSCGECGADLADVATEVGAQ